MSTLEVLKKKARCVSLEKLLKYLKDTGWRKTKEIEGYLSIWRFGDREGIFVPFDESAPDYEDAILKVLLTIERVEGRPATEILPALESTSKIASELCREIVDLRVLESVFGGTSTEVPAKDIGLTLKSFQEFSHSLAQTRRAGKRKTDESLQQEAELSLTETYVGSFGLRLGFYGGARQTDLFEGTLAEWIAQTLMDLVESSGFQDSGELIDRIAELNDKSLREFRALVKSLVGLGANIRLEWGSVNPEKGKIVELSYEDIVTTLTTLKKLQIQDSTTETRIGRLTLAGIGRSENQRRFVFLEDGTNKEYSGVIDLDLIDNLSENLELNKLYMGTFEKNIYLTEDDRQVVKLKLIELRSSKGDNLPERSGNTLRSPGE